MPGTLPNFLIIGAQKSGTTSLHQYIGGHPDVFVAPGKELHFFDRNLDKGLEWYQGNFAGVRGERAIGEATPNYMYSAEAISKMSEVIPEARLVAILRNPVDRAYSHYWHERARGRERLSFPDAVAAEPERLRKGDPETRYNCSYIDRGRYLYQLQQVCDKYPRKSLMVLLFEDLCRDPLASVRSVLAFLEVDQEFDSPDIGKAYNRRLPARSYKLRAITRRIPPLHRLVDPLNTPSESYPAMEPAVRTELEALFVEDNARLAEWLGKDISIWKSQKSRV